MHMRILRIIIHLILSMCIMFVLEVDPSLLCYVVADMFLQEYHLFQTQVNLNIVSLCCLSVILLFLSLQYSH